MGEECRLVDYGHKFILPLPHYYGMQADAASALKRKADDGSGGPKKKKKKSKMPTDVASGLLLSQRLLNVDPSTVV